MTRLDGTLQAHLAARLERTAFENSATFAFVMRNQVPRRNASRASPRGTSAKIINSINKLLGPRIEFDLRCLW
jgi:hypothetical protein